MDKGLSQSGRANILELLTINVRLAQNTDFYFMDFLPKWIEIQQVTSSPIQDSRFLAFTDNKFYGLRVDSATV